MSSSGNGREHERGHELQEQEQEADVQQVAEVGAEARRQVAQIGRAAAANDLLQEVEPRAEAGRGARPSRSMPPTKPNGPSTDDSAASSTGSATPAAPAASCCAVELAGAPEDAPVHRRRVGEPSAGHAAPPSCRIADAARREIRLASPTVCVAVVEDRRHERGARAARRQALVEVLERARRRPTRSPGCRPRSATARVSVEVVALLRAVAVHAGEQDLAGAARLHARRPLDARRARSACRPPCVNTSQPRDGSSGARRRASIATTMHCAPKRSGRRPHELGIARPPRC